MQDSRQAARDAAKRDREAHVVNARRVVPFAVGDRVRAFHPGRFGVVNYGTVSSVGRTFSRVDFGPLLGGSWKVRNVDVLEVTE